MPENAAPLMALPRGLIELTEAEFDWICRYLYEQTGIVLKDGKQALVKGRLERRLRHHQQTNFKDYFACLGLPGYEAETALAIDLLTTNETSFVREPAHFDFLRTQVAAHHQADRPFRVWSAASSSGEEAYTIAMTLADTLGSHDWEVVGTDISSRVIEQAAQGVYSLIASERLPQPWLKRYCLKGKDEFDGQFIIRRTIRERVHFYHANLMRQLPPVGNFDVIFLRNVMIYFDVETRINLVERLLNHLQPEGHFIISHSESLLGITQRLTALGGSIYQLSAG